MKTQAVSAQPPTQLRSKRLELKTDDFIKIMLTQLQHQDPLEPAKNQELLAQMNQIGQLQASTNMQEMLQGLSLQNQIGSSSQLIGKMVAGLDDGNEAVDGLVSSVRVQDNQVYLELDNGKTLRLDRVTEIAPARTTATTGSLTAAGSDNRSLPQRP
jgi:flagellar basal-body rod modification protein FlgD